VSVLDASAILALLNREAGGVKVAEHVDGAKVSAVNAAEVASKLFDVGLPVSLARAAISALGIEVVDFDQEQAWAVARLRSATKELGLSLGDRACLGLGLALGEVAVTADRSWSNLSDFDVLVIR
jgi:PIN domain nuclease of toxin-antitoxin system